MNTPIPASLLATLAQHFSDRPFTLFSVMTHAPIAEVDAWKTGLQALIAQGALLCIESRLLGDVYIQHPRGMVVFGIPVALSQVLACRFCGRLFVVTEILAFACDSEADDWRRSLNALVTLGVLHRVLGDMYVVVGGAE
ncbi:hypothetical protein [Serratia ureilytica]|uniref:Uncharacterized protein n=1 Tax=Serratia ureilytica TaxID=300181 RepID=A0A9X9BX93_9GAMM|nr:hypothetical protein [Serratia ureilytica]TXE22157.1 hypothetical protein FOT63_25580 [Serratia ureilytica]